jgi:hypothetical protein
MTRLVEDPPCSPAPVFGSAFTVVPPLVVPFVVLGFVGTTTTPPPEPWVGTAVTEVTGVAFPGWVATVVGTT